MLPGVLISIGCLPVWDEFRKNTNFQAALKGVNAAASGLMAGAVLVLWQKLVKGDAYKAMVVVFSFGLADVLGVKPYKMVVMAFLIGVGVGVYF